jgi:hypothetical protein
MKLLTVSSEELTLSTAEFIPFAGQAKTPSGGLKNNS